MRSKARSRSLAGSIAVEGTRGLTPGATRAVRMLAVVGVAVLACAPQGETWTWDGGRRDASATDCSPADCVARCAALGHETGTCSPQGVCVCGSGDPGAGDSERCDDGLDNNGDGAVDEGCACSPGTSQRCFSGPALMRGQGACRDGVQECRRAGEFGEWGDCVGQVLPSEEICDGADNDCDRVVDEGCPGTCTPTEFGRETNCNDGIDNDCDGLVDCWFDPDCPPCCGVEVCGDGVDNDCDGTADEGCTPCVPEVCGDGVDNDCDARSDCFDMDCVSYPGCVSCPPIEADCSDGLDNDCDTLVDCRDPDCASHPACGGGPPCTPTEARETSCNDGVDNDCDTLVDCRDPDCAPHPACGGGPPCTPTETRETSCSDVRDNDCDTLVDCDDPDCASHTACRPGCSTGGSWTLWNHFYRCDQSWLFQKGLCGTRASYAQSHPCGADPYWNDGGSFSARCAGTYQVCARVVSDISGCSFGEQCVTVTVPTDGATVTLPPFPSFRDFSSCAREAGWGGNGAGGRTCIRVTGTTTTGESVNREAGCFAGFCGNCDGSNSQCGSAPPHGDGGGSW